MCFKLMSFEINLGIENDKLLLETFRIWTHKMVFAEVNLQSVVIDVVLWAESTISPVANMASFVLVTTMREQLVISIEPHSTEATFRMSLESALIDSSRVIVAKLFMLFELLLREQFMLVGEDFLVPRAKIAHDLMMHSPYVAVQVWPTQTSNITTGVGTVVPQQQDRVFEDLGILVADAEVIVFLREVARHKIFVSLGCVVGENDQIRWSSAMGASFGLV